MEITGKQAEMMGKKLYTQTKNQTHCKEWAEKTLDRKQATYILNAVMKLNYNLATGNDADKAEYTRIKSWGREQIKALGYTELPINKSN